MLALDFLLIVSIQIGSSSIALGFAVKRFLKYKYSPDLILSFFFCDLLLWGVLTIIGGFTQNPQNANLLLQTSILVGIIGFVPLFLFFNAIYKTKYDSLLFSALFFILGGFFVSTVIYNGVKAYLVKNSNYYVLVFQTNFVRDLFMLTAGFMGIYIFLVSIVYMIFPLKKQQYAIAKVKYQIYLFLLSEILGSIGSAVTSYLVKNLSLENRVLPFFIIVDVCTILIIVGYLISPQTPLVIAATPISLFVVTESGVSLFTFNFLEREYANNELIGPVLSALLQFSKKTLRMEKELTEVNWGPLKLIVKPKGYLRFALLAEKSHIILDRALSNFADLFYNTYSKYLSNPKTLKNVAPFKNSEHLVEQVFTFISIKK